MKGKMKELNKKTISTLIMTILMLSMVIPLASAIEVPTFKDKDGTTITGGKVGIEVTVTVTGTTLGGLVKLYWDSVKDWDGKAGYLAEKYAVGAIATIKFVVPEAFAGPHYVITKDIESGASSPATFTVEPKIVLTPSKGLAGDTIEVKGTGFKAGTDVLMKYQGATSDKTLPTSPVTPVTTSLGSFTCTFKIPTDATTGLVKATADVTATATLTVGTYITLTPEKGVMGTTVTVKGRGFTADKKVDIRWYLTGDAYITVVDDYPIDSAGAFTATFTVPLVPDPTAPDDEYTIKAFEVDTYKAEAKFKVVAPAKITLTPTSGKAGTTVTVAGSWFTASKKVTFTFDGTTLTTSPGTVSTDANGAFSGVTFTVPTVAVGTYTVKATDETGVSATATFKVIVTVIEISTRATKYLQGDTISIYAKNSEELIGVSLEITDPTGMTFVKKTGVAIITLVKDWYVLSDYISISLPFDAPIGSWNFTAYDSITSKILDTNLFTVVESPGPATLAASNAAKAAADLASIKADAAKAAADSAKTAADAAKTAAEAAGTKATAAETAAKAATTAAQAAQTAAEAAGTKATAAETAAKATLTAAQAATTAAQAATSAANAAKAATDGLTTMVYAAIGASLVAALAAIVALMQISKKIA